MYILILDNFYVVNPNLFYRVQSRLTDFNSGSKKEEINNASTTEDTYFPAKLHLQKVERCSCIYWTSSGSCAVRSAAGCPKGFQGKGPKCFTMVYS